MSADFGLAPGRVLHFNESSWDALQNALAAKNLTLMAEHVAEQRRKPVVVLDLEPMYDGVDMGGWSYVVNTLRDESSKAVMTRGDIADQIEAQTKPPRIPEPGLWGVVDAGAGRIPVRRWVHHEEDWWVADTGDRVMWGDLEDPILVREGVQS